MVSPTLTFQETISASVRPSPTSGRRNSDITEPFGQGSRDGRCATSSTTGGFVRVAAAPAGGGLRPEERSGGGRGNDDEGAALRRRGHAPKRSGGARQHSHARPALSNQRCGRRRRARG